MKITVQPTPAPEGQQGPPTCRRRASSTTRAAASDSWRSLRDARGSLPLTSGTASSGKKKEDATAWYEGYRAGRRGEPRRSPHVAGTLQSWSWTGGWIEGKERREKDARHLDANREH